MNKEMDRVQFRGLLNQYKKPFSKKVVEFFEGVFAMVFLILLILAVTFVIITLIENPLSLAILIAGLCVILLNTLRQKI